MVLILIAIIEQVINPVTKPKMMQLTNTATIHSSIAVDPESAASGNFMND